MQIGKEEIKLSLLADNMIVYVENLKELTKKPPGTIMSRDYSKFSGFKVNIQKSIALLYTCNK